MSSLNATRWVSLWSGNCGIAAVLNTRVALICAQVVAGDLVWRFQSAVCLAHLALQPLPLLGRATIPVAIAGLRVELSGRGVGQIVRGERLGVRCGRLLRAVRRQLPVVAADDARHVPGCTV